MKRALVVAGLAVVVLAGCERMFTTSPFAFLQRDPSSYTEEQKIAFAEEALASGDREAMAAAYELLKDSADPETQLLAAELALGAAGVSAVLTDVVAGLATEGADAATVVADALEAFSEEDLQMLVEAAALLDEADDDDSVEPTAEQYVFAATGLIAAAAAGAGGVENLDPAPPEVQDYIVQAEAFLSAASAILVTEGGSTDILDELDGLISIP